MDADVPIIGAGPRRLETPTLRRSPSSARSSLLLLNPKWQASSHGPAPRLAVTLGGERRHDSAVLGPVACQRPIYESPAADDPSFGSIAAIIAA